MYKNLFFAVTPFNLYLIKRILDKHPGGTSIIIYHHISNSNLQKVTHQLQKINAEHDVVTLELGQFSSGLFRQIYTVFQMVMMKKNKIKNVYLASLNHSVFHYVMEKKLSYENFLTFDDGTANISESSPYFSKHNTLNIKERFLRFILNINLDHCVVKSNSEKHFTVFDKKLNAVQPPNMESISMKSNLKSKGLLQKDKLRILLGTPYDAQDKDTIRMLECLKSQYSINKYIPHPREDLQYATGVFDVIDKPEIAEETIYEYAANQCVEVYGFYSTTLANLAHDDNIDCFCLHIYEDEKHGKYAQVLEQCGVKLITPTFSF